jgi:hypothetical protein
MSFQKFTTFRQQYSQISKFQNEIAISMTTALNLCDHLKWVKPICDQLFSERMVEQPSRTSDQVTVAATNVDSR